MTGPTPLARRVVALALGLGFWLVLGVVTWLALTPSPPDPVTGISDIVAHALAFTTLTFLLTLAYLTHSGTRPGAGGPALGLRGNWHWWAATLMLLYGVALEILQSRVPERSAEFKDVCVDLAGIAAGLVLAAWLCGPLRRLLESGLALLLRR